jgi:hypothetical protein
MRLHEIEGEKELVNKDLGRHMANTTVRVYVRA